MITIGENELSIKDVYSILFEEKKIQLSEEAIQNVNNGYEFLIEFSKGKLIYGITAIFVIIICIQHIRKNAGNITNSHVLISLEFVVFKVCSNKK